MQRWNHIPCIHPHWLKLTILHHTLYKNTMQCKAQNSKHMHIIALIHPYLNSYPLQISTSSTKGIDNRIMVPVFKTYLVLFCKFPHFLCTQVTKLSTINQLNPMQQSFPWEVNSSSNSQEIHHVVWSSWVYSQVHKSQPLFSTLRKINQPTSSHPITLTSILILSSHPYLSIPHSLFPSGFPFVYFCSSSCMPEVS